MTPHTVPLLDEVFVEVVGGGYDRCKTCSLEHTEGYQELVWRLANKGPITAACCYRLTALDTLRGWGYERSTSNTLYRLRDGGRSALDALRLVEVPTGVVWWPEGYAYAKDALGYAHGERWNDAGIGHIRNSDVDWLTLRQKAWQRFLRWCLEHPAEAHALVTAVSTAAHLADAASDGKGLSRGRRIERAACAALRVLEATLPKGVCAP